jgi:hypothetical protein
MNGQKEIEKLYKRTNEYRYLQIKENKKSYYAVDEWLDKHDYDLQLQVAIMNGVNVPVDQVPKTMFRRLNWNQMNYENLSMMKMYVEFFDENLEMVFLLTMSDHVEKIHDPLDAPKQWEKTE